MEELSITNKYSECNSIDDFYEEYVSAYITKYVVNISNTYLKKYRILKARELYDLKYKIAIQFMDWAEKERSLREKNNIVLSVEERNVLYKQVFNEIDNILLHTLNVNDAINWESLKSRETFKIPKPKPCINAEMSKWEKENPLVLSKEPEEPLMELFKPDLSFFDKIIPKRKRLKENESALLYKEAYSDWQTKCNEIKEYNKKKEIEYNLLKDEFYKSVQRKDEDDLNSWKERKDLFYKERSLQHQRVDEFKKRYIEKDNEAIEDYCEIVLNNSEYPDFISKDFRLEYNGDNKILIIEYQLPNIELFPVVKECKFIVSKREIKTTSISTSELNKIYDKALYDMTLRTIHEIFEADINDAIDAVSFNGWVLQIDKATGNEVNNCIISIQVQKEEFLKINLQNVDSKACFKGLKGVSSSKLFQTTPIRPILQIKKEDKRFVESYDVSEQIDNSTNLALMDWEDFEHLIREIFGKEFSSNGGEVKVTQASRDGGVDAIAFDPDPIRGGKIVIQAKRYTNTVGVSAVRDLYGTVMNEGATKGILVTTADYGPDAYSFVKDKPLTLLNGSNLLFLLEKHGIHAKIDIKEAKLLNN